MTTILPPRHDRASDTTMAPVIRRNASPYRTDQSAKGTRTVAGGSKESTMDRNYRIVAGVDSSPGAPDAVLARAATGRARCLLARSGRDL